LHIRPWEWKRLTVAEGMALMDYIDSRRPEGDDE
jgi:hypothetical protein